MSDKRAQLQYTCTPEPLQAVAAVLRGEGSVLKVAPRSPAAAADRVQRALGVLLASDDPDAVWLGQQLERRLVDGGDLEKLLGLKVRRGGSYATPQRVRKRKAMQTRLCDLVAQLPGTEREKFIRLKEMVECREPSILEIERETGERVPKTPARLQLCLVRLD